MGTSENEVSIFSLLHQKPTSARVCADAALQQNMWYHII